MKKRRTIFGGCITLSVVLLVISCWLATLIFGLPTIALLQGLSQ